MAGTTAAGDGLMATREHDGTVGNETWPAVEAVDDGSVPELVSPDQLLRFLDESENADEAEEDGVLPQIVSMPEGIKVDERRVGRAVARWILQVRCDCGRRWFEAEALDTATCPRCGVLVYVDMDAHSKRP
jgi:hypothetical protein